MARTTAAQQSLAKRRLLAVAAEHFADHGFDGANVNTIAIEAGYAKGTIYNHFASKLDLLTAVLESGSELATARSQSRQGDDLRANLLALTEEDARLVRENEAFMRVVAREMLTTNPETRAAVDRGLRPFEDAIRQIFEDAQSQSNVDSSLTPEQLGHTYGALLMSIYVMRWRSGNGWPTWEDLPGLAVSTFLDGNLRGPR